MSVQTQTTVAAPKTRPVFSQKIGSCEVAVWEQTGEKGNFLTVNMARNYKDKDGTWKKTNTLRVNDIPQIVLGLNKSYEFAKLQHKSASEDSE